MKNLCLINQPAGLGDIMLCQKIADAVIAKGYQIYWPVIDQYLEDVKRYMQKDGITFCSANDDFPLKQYYSSGLIRPTSGDNGELYLPLRYADLSYPGESVLRSKFKILNANPSRWQRHLKFSRDANKENELFYDVLGLSNEDSYAFTNLWYGSPPSPEKKNVSVATNIKNVEMKTIDGFSVFDWCKVIEKASEIYCVDTSLFYVIDLLEIKAKTLEAYSKFDPSDYKHIAGLFEKPWRYN